MRPIGLGRDAAINHGAFKIENVQHIRPSGLGCRNRGKIAHQYTIPNALFTKGHLIDPGIDPLLPELGTMPERPLVVTP